MPAVSCLGARPQLRPDFHSCRCREDSMVPGRHCTLVRLSWLSPRAESETANLGGRAQKGESRCQEERRGRLRRRLEDSLKVCRSFAGVWRESIWGASSTGCALQRWTEVVAK